MRRVIDGDHLLTSAGQLAMATMETAHKAAELRKIETISYLKKTAKSIHLEASVYYSRNMHAAYLDSLQYTTPPAVPDTHSLVFSSTVHIALGGGQGQYWLLVLLMICHQRHRHSQVKLPHLPVIAASHQTARLREGKSQYCCSVLLPVDNIH